MKVVQILPDLHGGGVERGTLEIAAGLVHAGHESIVISAGGRMVPQLEAEGSRHVMWELGRKSLLTLRHVFKLRQWLLAERPDILHLRSRLPAWVAWLAWKSLPISSRPKLVTTVHGLYSVSAYSEVMCKGERVIAVSNTVRDYIRQNYPKTDVSKVRLVYRGIDPAEFPAGYQPSAQWREEWQNAYPQLIGQKVLTLPGRLTRLKGHHDFIQLIKHLSDAGVPVCGLIVGGEDPKRQSYATELYQRVKEEGLSDNVLFTGNRSDIRDIYAVSDAVLSLSTKPESFGRTVIEALSVGTPVVGYDHGGVGEMLSVYFPEGLCPMSDPNALSERVVQVLSCQLSLDTPLPLKADMVAQTLAVYEELLMLSDAKVNSH